MLFLHGFFAPFPSGYAGLHLFWANFKQLGGVVLGVCRLGNGVRKMSPSLLFSFSEVAPCTEGTAGLSVAEGMESTDSL